LDNSLKGANKEEKRDLKKNAKKTGTEGGKELVPAPEGRGGELEREREEDRE